MIEESQLLGKIVMKESLMIQLDEQYEQLKSANAFNAKQKAKDLLSTVREIFQHQAKVNAAVQKLLIDGFTYRKELELQLAELKEIRNDSVSQVEQQ